jgi:hypothetical protein
VRRTKGPTDPEPSEALLVKDRDVESTMTHKKRRARRRPENLVRLVNATGVSVGVSVSAAQERGEETSRH